MGSDNHKGHNRKDIYSILVSFWSTRVSILLSARSIFIAIETVIFSVGVYLASLGTNFLLMLVVCILGGILAVLWRWICANLRCKEHYFRWRILQFEKAKYSSEKVWSDFVNFLKELKENQKKKRSELSRDCEWKQSEPKWFPGGVLNTGLPWVFIGLFIVLIMIFTLSN